MSPFDLAKLIAFGALLVIVPIGYVVLVARAEAAQRIQAGQPAVSVPRADWQFGMNAPLSVMLLMGMLLAGAINGGYVGLMLAGLAIFALAMAKKAHLIGPMLWMPRATVAEWIVVVVICEMLAALLMPARRTHCEGRRSVMPSVPTATTPAATPALDVGAMEVPEESGE